MFIQLSEVMYYALLEPDMDFIFKERGRFNVKARITHFLSLVKNHYYLRQVNADRWELNANSSKTFKATDFKFDTRVPRDSLDMTPKNFPKEGVARVTWPPKFLGVKC